MRPDQAERIQGIADRLIERVLQDADPENWPGHGKPPNKLTQQERGDGVWARKLAIASLMLLERVNGLAAGQMPDGTDARDIEGEVRRAEREASRLLAKIARGAKP